MNFKFKILFHEQYVKYLILYHFGLEFVYKPKFVKYSYCNKDKKKSTWMGDRLGILSAVGINFCDFCVSPKLVIGWSIFWIECLEGLFKIF